MRDLADRLVDLLQEAGPLSPPELAQRLAVPEGQIHGSILSLRQKGRIVPGSAAFLYRLVFPSFAAAARREQGGVQLLCAVLGEQVLPVEVLLEQMQQGGVGAEETGRLLDLGVDKRWLRSFWDLRYRAAEPPQSIASSAQAAPAAQVDGRLG